MSVLIRGMSMPENCAKCRLWSICECLKDFEDYVSVLEAVDDGDLVRDSNCPLVEVKVPYGRLIDAYKLLEDHGIKLTEELAPTVIAAEWSEE